MVPIKDYEKFLDEIALEAKISLNDFSVTTDKREISRHPILYYTTYKFNDISHTRDCSFEPGESKIEDVISEVLGGMKKGLNKDYDVDSEVDGQSLKVQAVMMSFTTSEIAKILSVAEIEIHNYLEKKTVCVTGDTLIDKGMVYESGKYFNIGEEKIKEGLKQYLVKHGLVKRPK